MEYFFHDTIKTYTGVFGHLFSDFKIKNGSKTIKVPIEFKAKNKSVVRNEVDLDEPKIRMTLPRMSFNLVGMELDQTRKTNHRLKIADIQNIDENGVRTQYNRVPYNFIFSLDIKTKNIGDMSQILEQILVYFDGGVNVIIKDNDELNTETDVYIRLLSTNKDDEIIGSYDNYRSIETSLQFSLEGYLYKRTSEVGVIRKIIIETGILDLDEYDPDIIVE